MLAQKSRKAMCSGATIREKFGCGIWHGWSMDKRTCAHDPERPGQEGNTTWRTVLDSNGASNKRTGDGDHLLHWHKVTPCPTPSYWPSIRGDTRALSFFHSCCGFDRMHICLVSGVLHPEVHQILVRLLGRRKKMMSHEHFTSGKISPGDLCVTLRLFFMCKPDIVR